MTATTTRRLGRYVAVGFGAAGAIGVLGAGSAAASPLGDGLSGLADAAATAAQDMSPVAPALPPVPGLPSPVIPLDAGILPQNLLRTGSRDDDGTADPTEGIATETTTGEGVDQASISAGFGRYNDRVSEQSTKNQQLKEQLAQFTGITAEDLRDDSAIGQAAGTFTPDGQTFADIREAVSAVVTDITSGQVVQDIQTVVDNVTASPEYIVWRDNESNPFNPDRVGADGVADLIDSFTTNPVATIDQMVVEAGGPVRILTDPVGAFNDVVSGIAGDAFLNDVWDFVNNDLAPDFAESLRQAAPALLLIPASAALGALLGAPLGALPGSGIGAIIGALSPHNLLAAIPGAILGGLATGIPGALAGLIGSTLAFLPLIAGLPLLGAAGGSALALAIAATITYGTWLLSFIPVALVGGLLGIGAALLVGVGLLALSLNPIMIPAAIGGGILAGLFVFTMLVGGYALLTFLIPTIIFAIIAPLLTLGLGGLGALLGLGAGLAAAAIGIPLITALMAAVTALPGAVLGGLLGVGLSSLVSALIGAGIGALVGAGIGGLIGAVLGTLLGTLVGVPLFLAIALLNFADHASEWGNGPLGRIMDTLRQGWERSLLKDLVDRIAEEWNNSQTGSDLNHLFDLVNSMFTSLATLDGRRLRNLLLRGGALGAVIGGLTGAAIGGPLGFLAGLFNPLNLLGGLMGAITGALVGAPLGAALGKGLSMLLGVLTTLAVTPLVFLPILAALTGLWATLAIPATLVALASTLIGPLALAVGATIIGGLLLSSPLWVPLTLVATVLTLIAFALSNPVIVAALTAAIPGIGGILSMGAAFVIGAVGAGLATLDVIVILGALALAAVFIGLPVFLLTIPLFIFPALAVPLLALLALPLMIPVAAGLSLLTGMAAGALVDNLSSLLTVPLGALLGALTGATIGGVAGTLVNALVRAIVYSIAGAGLGAVAGAGIGAPLGALIALLTSLRGDAGYDGDTVWGNGRIVPNDFLDALPIPGVGTTKSAPVAAIPATADPAYATGMGLHADSAVHELDDASELVAA